MLHVPIRQAPALATPFRINPELDLAAIRRAYEAEGRVRIYNLLADGAAQLHDHLSDRPDWIYLINNGADVLEIDPAERVRIGKRRWAALEAEAHQRVREAFQYRYQALRVPTAEEMASLDDPLTDFARFMQSGEMLDFLRAATGHEALSFTDGQATAYGPGDFLTGHDDDVEGKDRLAAYVFGLTPYWRLEYGGLLLFHGEHDRTAAGNVPRFNTLDLFSVPRQHSVSIVTPAAPHRRMAVTGWLRSGSR